MQAGRQGGNPPTGGPAAVPVASASGPAGPGAAGTGTGAGAGAGAPRRPSASNGSNTAATATSNATSASTNGTSRPGGAAAPGASNSIGSNSTNSRPAGAATNAAPAGGAGTAAPAGGLTQAQRQLQRQLNVKDALSYLDQVKMKFEKQPEIYNRFLDIMKDFKTQVIDTPGVIDRVSSLFRNHPSLISGFNTFLPNGFRIECHTDPENGIFNSITVITPMGAQKLTPDPNADLIAGPPGAARQSAQGTLGAGNRAVPATTNGQGRVDVSRPAASASTSASVTPATRPAASNVPAATDSRVAKQEPVDQSRLLGRTQPPASTPSAPPHEPATRATSGPPPASSAIAVKDGTQLSQQNLLQAGSPPLGAVGGQQQLSGGSSDAGGDRRAPIEFNHAISYVNKIKTRFSREPEIYKTFLDILQTYQREQRAIQHVYAQVTTLFRGAPDLLDEFKQFLPDHSQTSQEDSPAAQASAAADKRRTAQASTNAMLSAPKAAAAGPVAATAAAPAITSKPYGRSGPGSAAGDDYPPLAAPIQAKRKRAGQGDGMVSDSGVSMPNESLLAQTNTAGASAVAAKQKSARGSKRSGAGATAGMKDPTVPVQQSSARYEPGSAGTMGDYVQPILSYLPPGYTLPAAAGAAFQHGPAPVAHETPEEAAFFDRVAAYIDDQFTYYEFLKLLNLFTQDIIDLPTLASRAYLFIGGSPDLWTDFRELVGWRDGVTPGGRIIENGEWIVENIPAVERKSADLSKCEAAGPSYRRLPKSEMQMNCSGRDQLCWEVLNDEWVSVMNLGSEEFFLAHKKNPFEEALHRTEEERHEYDFHIEANLRTIALLEPIAARIAAMDTEERMTFRLKPGLGNQSKSIYQRIIKKIYGKELGREVIHALHENPCVSVPVVLARLKQKDEEWRRSLREWNRVWREVDAKNFYRSLDHQGITFKAQDKRSISSKALVSEIEILRRTEMQKIIALPVRLRPPPPTYQLGYTISDENVLFDSLKLFLSYLDRAPGYHTLAERDRIEAFLRSLASLVFAIPVTVLDSMLTPVQDDSGSAETSDEGDVDMASDSAASSIDQPLSKRSGSQALSVAASAAKKAADLRKQALKNAGEVDGRAARDLKDDGTPDPIAPSQAGADVQAAGDIVMGDSSADVTRSEAQRIVEGASNGDSAFKNEVPATAAGLEGMQGVQVVHTGAEVKPGPDAATPTQPANAAGAVTGGTTAPASGAAASGGSGNEAAASPPTPSPQAEQQKTHEVPILQPARPPGEPQIRRFNFFCNMPYYSAIRLLQILYSRLHTMKQTAQALASAPAKPEGRGDGVMNSSYTMYGKATPKVSGNQELPSSASIYDSMLELCEKLFGSEIDQGQFEDNMRGLFGNQAYHMFTIDKVVSALVKMVWGLIDANREVYHSNGEIFKLLVDDRRYPKTAQAQQISYRINAELAAGSDENLYRIEWLPRRHLLTFQLLGKDEVLPEDENDLSKIWEQYLQSYLVDDVTQNLPLDISKINKGIFLKRNVISAQEGQRRSPAQLVVKSELETRVCMRSLKMFWMGRTEDSMHRVRPGPARQEVAQVSSVRKQRFQRWLREVDNKRIAAAEKARESALHRLSNPRGMPTPTQASPTTQMTTGASTASMSASVPTNAPRAASASASGSTSNPSSALASREQSLSKEQPPGSEKGSATPKPESADARFAVDKPVESSAITSSKPSSQASKAESPQAEKSLKSSELTPVEDKTATTQAVSDTGSSLQGSSKSADNPPAPTVADSESEAQRPTDSASSQSAPVAQLAGTDVTVASDGKAVASGDVDMKEA